MTREELEVALAYFGNVARPAFPELETLLIAARERFAQLEGPWFIEREHGRRIAGPFTTEDDANHARVWVEKVLAPETFWIRKS